MKEDYKQDMVYGIRPVLEAIDAGKEVEDLLMSTVMGQFDVYTCAIQYYG